MPNTLANPSWVIKEVGRYWLNNIQFLKNCKRTYDDQFVQAGAKMGDTVNYRLPQKFVANSGSALQVQALYDQTVPMTLSNQTNVGFGYSSGEATVNLDDIRGRYVMPAAETLAAEADKAAFSNVYTDVYNSVGTPGTTTSTQLTYLQAGVKLTDLGTPKQGRVGVLDPLAMATLANTSASLFNPQALIGQHFTEGEYRRTALGVSEWMEDSNRPLHTTGSFTAATPLVAGASQTGSTIDIDGWASGATSLKKGDILTMAGVYSVHPISKVSTGRLQQFVVTADTSDSSGETATLPISPSIITSGALQTVSNSPANNAVVLVWAATSGGALTATVSPTGMLFVPDAFAFVTADLAMPRGGALAERTRSKNFGMAIRYVEQFNITTDQNLNRLDILHGSAAVRPEFACRLVG